MATTPVADTAHEALNEEASLTPTETNVGALIQEWRLEQGLTNWETYVANAKTVAAAGGTPVGERSTAADALHAYYLRLSVT